MAPFALKLKKKTEGKRYKKLHRDDEDGPATGVSSYPAQVSTGRSALHRTPERIKSLDIEGGGGKGDISSNVQNQAGVVGQLHVSRTALIGLAILVMILGGVLAAILWPRTQARVSFGSVSEDTDGKTVRRRYPDMKANADETLPMSAVASLMSAYIESKRKWLAAASTAEGTLSALRADANDLEHDLEHAVEQEDEGAAAPSALLLERLRAVFLFGSDCIEAAYTRAIKQPGSAAMRALDQHRQTLRQLPHQPDLLIGVGEDPPNSADIRELVMQLQAQEDKLLTLVEAADAALASAPPPLTPLPPQGALLPPAVPAAAHAPAPSPPTPPPGPEEQFIIHQHVRYAGLPLNTASNGGSCTLQPGLQDCVAHCAGVAGCVAFEYVLPLQLGSQPPPFSAAKKGLAANVKAAATAAKTEALADQAAAAAATAMAAAATPDSDNRASAENEQAQAEAADHAWEDTERDYGNEEVQDEGANEGLGGEDDDGDSGDGEGDEDGGGEGREDGFMGANDSQGRRRRRHLLQGAGSTNAVASPPPARRFRHRPPTPAKPAPPVTTALPPLPAAPSSSSVPSPPNPLSSSPTPPPLRRRLSPSPPKKVTRKQPAPAARGAAQPPAPHPATRQHESCCLRRFHNFAAAASGAAIADAAVASGWRPDVSKDGFNYEPDVVYGYLDVGEEFLPSDKACANACAAWALCTAFSWIPDGSMFKDGARLASCAAKDGGGCCRLKASRAPATVVQMSAGSGIVSGVRVQSKEFTIQTGLVDDGPDLISFHFKDSSNTPIMATPIDCANMCAYTHGCEAYVFRDTFMLGMPSLCTLKSAAGALKLAGAHIKSGRRKTRGDGDDRDE